MNLTNRKIQQLETELESLYDAIQGSDPDSDWYETMCIKIAEKNEEIATERMVIGDLAWIK